MKANNNIQDWIPAAFNNGWIYRQQLTEDDSQRTLISALFAKSKQATLQDWNCRLEQGQIKINNQFIHQDCALNNGDVIEWHRPPWREDAVPANWDLIFDNGDLLVINKPSGLPVIPGGGFLKHTLTELLKQKYKNESIPIPIHRLGRYTSGLLVCARKKSTRNKLSQIFRTMSNRNQTSFLKIYRALASINTALQKNKLVEVNTPIKRITHPLIGSVWGADQDTAYKISNKHSDKKLNAFSTVELLERRINSDLLKIIIRTGRPHQIRIHLSSLGSPLIGDPLYKGDKSINKSATPGEGGFHLHAHRLEQLPIYNEYLSFEAPPPKILLKENE